MQGASVISNILVSQAGLRGAFYQLAVELVAIETKVLLMDALRAAPLEEAGDAPQKATSGEQCLHRSLAPAASRQAAFPAVSFSLTENFCCHQHGRRTMCTSPQNAELHSHQQRPAIQIRTWKSRCPAIRPGKASGTRSQRPRAGAGTPVQQTAERLLPSCFRLLEAAVELLAADSQDGTGLLDPR